MGDDMTKAELAKHNSAKELFRNTSKDFNKGVALEPNARDLTLLAILDHFNAQHWHDRGSYHQRIMSLEYAQPKRAKTIIDPEYSGGSDAA
jgi:hypothetical protein